MAVEHLTAVVGAKISEYKRKMAEVKAIAANAAREIKVQVDANTQPFQRAMAKVVTIMSAVNGRTVWVNIRARSDRFENQMHELASVIRTFSTVWQNMLLGGLMTVFPAIVPVIAGLTAALATTGVAIGVMSGSLLSLISSFSIAALGGLAFAGALIPTIQNIKSARTEINEGRRALESYSKPMQYTITMLKKMKKSYLSLNQAIEPYVLMAFGNGMETAVDLMRIMEPGIIKVAQAFQGLMEKMKNTVNNAKDMKANFAWFNARAGKAVSAWGEIIGYAFRGFLNLMRAFDPLAKTTEQGLLNMTKRFSEWADGLSKSDKFKAFMDYVRENMPKINSIIGNLIKGFINMFVAFAPLASDMLTGFQKMTQRFKEWSAALSDNKAFQDFVSYIRETGPGVLAFIGNFTTFLIELGKGMAPLGAFLLDMVNKFLSLTNSFMKANPWFGHILAAAISLMGVFRMIVPVILFLRSAFSGLFITLGRGVMIVISYLPLVGQKLMQVGTLIGRFLLQVASWAPKVLSVFSSLVMGIGKWFMMLGTVIWEAIAVIGTVLGQLLLRIATVVGGFFTNIFMIVGRALVIAASWVPFIVGIIAKVVGAVGGFFGRIAWMLGEFVVILGRVLIQGLLWAARMAAMWIIAAGPIAWVIAAVVALVALIIWKWDEVKKYSIIAWTAIWNFLKTAWEYIKQIAIAGGTAIVNLVKQKWETLKSATSAVWNAIKTYISNTWNNIKSDVQSISSAVVSYVKSKWEEAKSNTQAIWNAVKSFIQSAWDNIKSTVQNALSTIINAVKSKFEQMKSNIQSVFDTVKSFIRSAWENIKSATSSQLSSILSAVRSKFQEILSAVKDKLNSVLSSVKSIWQSITSFLRGIDLASIGANIIQGLINGVKSKATSLINSVKGVVGGAIDKAKNLLNINSPSRVFMEFGEFTGEGFAIGMKDTMRTVARASSAMIGAAIPTLSPLEVATPASNAVYTPRVNMPEIEVSNKEENTGGNNANITLRLGRRDFVAHVGDISNVQKEIELREQREAGR